MRRIEVVVVDDEAQITELLKTFINCASESAIVHTFNDSSIARDFLMQNWVDILITDYKMPKYDGIQLMEITAPDVTKILISGYISEVAEERLGQMNAIFLEKPVPMKTLSDIIQEQEKRVLAAY